ncbi:Lrp/AsnC ligand binding domain-containing protein [Bacteriovorax sp. Seq25_V]|uniref:Lrp/AsnC ligand binding domain-containing protein n=1 Tax=Bacteriovorax sp. Seq25_V TaxID=1201288 RepID=UPI00038A2325|nr:Lrp/AsnC ligand binding domain-containing protein [Bacteriovorax sp. Seq25_V]EQC47504.1 MarR family protein [Bacteriovorax sp. Seq25_V]
MTENYEIDSLDIKILNYLRKDARLPFSEIARKLYVSSGTIHQRVEKLREAKIITGSKISLDYKKLNYNVTVLLGIHLNNAGDVEKVIAKLDQLDEVSEAFYTTGNYALIVKIMVSNIDHFHDFLVKKLQAIKEIRSTESFISLKQVIDKDVPISM